MSYGTKEDRRGTRRGHEPALQSVLRTFRKDKEAAAAGASHLTHALALTGT